LVQIDEVYFAAKVEAFAAGSVAEQHWTLAAAWTALMIYRSSSISYFHRKDLWWSSFRSKIK
jgi:hypothetical protein